MIETTTLVDMYLVMKEYINEKDRQAVADQVFSTITDSDISEQALVEFSSADSYLKAAAADYLDDKCESEENIYHE